MNNGLVCTQRWSTPSNECNVMFFVIKVLLKKFYLSNEPYIFHFTPDYCWEGFMVVHNLNSTKGIVVLKVGSILNEDDWMGSAIFKQSQVSNIYLQMAKFSGEKNIENIFETNIGWLLPRILHSWHQISCWAKSALVWEGVLDCKPRIR